MALEKSSATSFGYPAMYWKIRYASSPNAGADSMIDIVLDGFKDKAAADKARAGQGSPLAQRSYKVFASDFDAIEVGAPDPSDDGAENEMIRKAYLWIKANVSEFDGATDV